VTASDHPIAVILGGTGHIGAAVARRFAEGGFAVRASGRRAIPRPNLDGTGIAVVCGDDTDPELLQRWTKDAAVVVDCATPYPVWMHDRPAQEVVQAAVDRARAVIAATDAAGARLVLISSFTTLPRTTGLWGAIGQGVLAGAHPYFDLKAAVEDHVCDYLAQGGQGAVVAPSTCFGPYDLKPREQTFIPMLLGGEVKALTDHAMNVVDVRDVADVVFAAAAAGIRRPIPVFGHDIGLQALVQTLCEMRGVTPPGLTAPKGGAAFGAAGLHVVETAFALAGRKTPWPSLPALLLAASYPAAPSPVQRQLHPGLRPLHDTLTDAIAWYERIGSLRL
jgi:nucleoside-diphosphate-sugar epimerase